MALAVVTPNHLEKIGLLKKEQLESNEKVELVNGMKVSKNDLTYLFSKSLDKVKDTHIGFLNILRTNMFPFVIQRIRNLILFF